MAAPIQVAGPCVRKQPQVVHDALELVFRRLPLCASSDEVYAVPPAHLQFARCLRDQLERWFVGTPTEIVEQMRPYLAGGVDLFMLQHFVLDDAEALNLLASEVMPRLS